MSRLAALLALLSLLLTGSLLVPGSLSGALFALVGVAFPVVLIAFGARRGAPGEGRRGLDPRLAAVLVALFVILELSTVLVMVLSGGSGQAGEGAAGGALAAVVQIVGLWLVPLPLVALAYALTFDRSGVTRADLARLRRRHGRRSGAGRGEA